MPELQFETVVDSWWDDDYFYRRFIDINAESHGSYDNFVVPAGHPIEVQLPYADLAETNKVRSDFRDLEILYYTDTLGPTWTQVPREIIPVVEEDYVIVRFLLQADLSDAERYFVYYGSATASKSVEGDVTYPGTDFFPSLEVFPGIFSRTLVPSLWPIQVEALNSQLDYTRQRDHWLFKTYTVAEVVAAATPTSINTVVPVVETKTPNARVSLEFPGPHVRIQSVLGPDFGMATVILDQQPPVTVDLYSSTIQVGTCYEAYDLGDLNSHRITFMASKSRNPVSLGTKANIVSIDFFHKYDVYVSSETVKPSISWGASIGGG